VNDPYAMPGGVLRNKLGITDHQLLAAAEADITRARLVMLAERPLPGAYDLDHFQAFHAAIFGDIYPWAGELRTVNIAKRTPFCPARNLVPYAGEVFGRLASSGRFRYRGTDSSTMRVPPDRLGLRHPPDTREPVRRGPGSVVVGMHRSEVPPGNRRVN